jgi:ubiquinone/menaquinone biosynthesis C-methylase UbiE
MELIQATKLIKHPDISTPDKTLWADLGCGSGLFTHALAGLLARDSKIYAVDKDAGALKRIHRPDAVTIESIEADFINDMLGLHDLNGILMANSLHYVEDKMAFIKKIEKYFAAEPTFLIVEYNTDVSNPWVPYPLSFQTMQSLFKKLEYNSIHAINEVPSRYNQAKMYSVLIKK